MKQNINFRKKETGLVLVQKIFAPVEINILRVAIARLMVKVIIHGTRTELQIIMEFSDKNKHFLTKKKQKEKDISDWLCAVCAFILITLHRYNIAQLIYQLIS